MNSNIFSSPNTKNRSVGCILAASCLVIAFASPSAAQSIWTGASGTWSGNGNPGWNGTGVPTVGSTANLGSGVAKTVTLDVSGTTGSLYYDGAGNFLTTLTLTGGLTFDSSGGASVLGNSNTNAGTSNRLSVNAGTITMANDLTISNTGNSTNTTGAIVFASSAAIAGTGNLTLFNVSNSVSSGAIVFQGTNTFLGNVAIQKGAVFFSYSSGTSFGNSANVVTLGSAGNGDATWINTASANTVANNIVVANGSGGKLLLGSNSAAASNTIFAGTILLNDNVTLTSSKAATADTRYTGVISGVGGVTIEGTGETQFGNGTASITNTYEGNTVLTETSSLVLSDNAKMTFYIKESGVNNKILGAGTTVGGNVLTLDGDFVFDLTAASTSVGASWLIVDVDNLNQTFSNSFTVVDFAADVGGVLWTKDIDGTNYYQFSEATGILSVVPEPGVCALAGTGLALVLFRRRRH